MESRVFWWSPVESKWIYVGHTSEVLDTREKGVHTLYILFPHIEFTKDSGELKLDNKLLVDIVMYKYLYNSNGS
jgi:hypothetical protein